MLRASSAAGDPCKSLSKTNRCTMFLLHTFLIILHFLPFPVCQNRPAALSQSHGRRSKIIGQFEFSPQLDDKEAHSGELQEMPI